MRTASHLFLNAQQLGWRWRFACACTLAAMVTPVGADDHSAPPAPVAAGAAGEYAQGKVERQTDRVGNAIDNKVDQKTDEAVDKTLGKLLDKLFK